MHASALSEVRHRGTACCTSRLCNLRLPEAAHPFATALPSTHPTQKPREMTLRDIDATVDAFAAGAKRALRAGFQVRVPYDYGMCSRHGERIVVASASSTD